jgi:hypothetical protein
MSRLPTTGAVLIAALGIACSLGTPGWSLTVDNGSARDLLVRLRPSEGKPIQWMLPTDQPSATLLLVARAPIRGALEAVDPASCQVVARTQLPPDHALAVIGGGFEGSPYTLGMGVEVPVGVEEEAFGPAAAPDTISCLTPPAP